MTENARSRRRRAEREVVDENDPLEYARLLADSVDEDTEKSPTTWLLKAIAIAQIDQAQAARAAVRLQMQRDADLNAAMGRQMDMMAPVADAARRHAEEARPPAELYMVARGMMPMMPLEPGSPPTDEGPESTATNANANVLCQCNHMGQAHVQGNGECLMPMCGCETFRGR